MDLSLQLHLRPSQADDAMPVSRLIDRTIRLACASDHHNDTRLLEAWTRSTSVEQIQRRLGDPAITVRLAILQGKRVGVAMAHVEGEVLLCHVQPEFIRRGIGTALMAELENHLLEQGCISAYLNSTQSGRGFYHRLGYRETGQPQHHAGLNVMPMEKSLLHGSLGGWAEGLSAGL